MNAKYQAAKEKKRPKRSDGVGEIKDLIVQLIAKENLPIRIVESVHFTKLLQGNFMSSALTFQIDFTCSILLGTN